MEWISSNNQSDKNWRKKLLLAWSPLSTNTWSAYRTVVCLSPWVKSPRSDELALLHVCKYSDVCVTRLFYCLDICLGNGLLFTRGYFLFDFIFLSFRPLRIIFHYWTVTKCNCISSMCRRRVSWWTLCTPTGTEHRCLPVHQQQLPFSTAEIFAPISSP